MSDDSTRPYPRDLVGYGQHAPHAQWPGQARIALQFVLNYEEGGENATLHGDAGSEIFLSEMFSPPSFSDRHLSMESIYEYGSRVGVWRILREFEKRKLPLTVFGVSMALERHPDLTQAFVTCLRVGTRVATVPTRAACCSTMAVWNTTATITVTTCRFGCGCKKPMVRWCRIWWCPTPWT
jgi:peptidoglycan/xylan/chitin deacetylase (PgdA/CDA1 family)